MPQPSRIESFKPWAESLTVAIGLLTLIFPAVRKALLWFWRTIVFPFIGMPYFVGKIREEQAQVRREVQTNGGGSLKDLVIEGLRELNRNTWLTQEQINAQGLIAFTTDENGARTWSSDAWCRLTGIANHEATGAGWLSALDPDDVDRVQREWARALKEKRNFVVRYRIRGIGLGKVIAVEADVHAIPDKNGRLVAYYGRVRLLEPELSKAMVTA